MTEETCTGHHHPTFDSIDEKLMFQLSKCSRIIARHTGPRRPESGPQGFGGGPGRPRRGPEGGMRSGCEGHMPPDGPGPEACCPPHLGPRGPEGLHDGAIHPGQLRVLEALESEDKLTQSELRGKLDIRAASLSELLAKLEDKGLIVRERNESDKRSIDVYLTDLGADCISEAKEQRKKMAEKMLGALSEEEKQQLSDLLCKLIHSWRDGKQGRAHD